MPADPQRVQAVYLAAVKLPDSAGRTAFLTAECGDDHELRQQVEGLLSANQAPGGVPPFSEMTGDYTPDPSDFTLQEQEESVARQIIAGRYVLRSKLGEGGMGEVWLAEQTEPLKRSVAVKLIKFGMDSKLVLARFDVERQALGLMDHPSIARIFDGGVTAQGQPYFVMELVRGMPLTDYCDQRRLTVADRLQLFVQVCQAVQHAHQKGIIHRDLKPSNVLVTEVDGRPLPKVIDFGVAKATEQKLTEQTLNDAGLIVGTPSYMSPEQTDPACVDVDTRSDVYTLGVILYELLVGSPPIDARQFRRGALFEMLRMVREVEPPRPSTKLSQSDGLSSIAEQRSVEPARLVRMLRGELDWVVARALEKDRARRYETANSLARDLQRYLADEVVEARPPSRAYRLSKFVKRNRWQVIAASLLLIALLAGVVGTSIGYLHAEQQREIAETKEREARIQRDAKDVALKAEAAARAAEQKARDRALTALRSLTDEVVEYQLARDATLSDETRAFLRKIIEQYDGFASIQGDDERSREIRAEGLARIGLLQFRLSELKEAEVSLNKARYILDDLRRDSLDGSYSLSLARCLNNLGNLFRFTSDFTEAELAFKEAADVLNQCLAIADDNLDAHWQLAQVFTNLGLLQSDSDRVQEAESSHRAALAIEQRVVTKYPGRQNFRMAMAMSHNNLGVLLARVGRYQEAEAALLDALAIRRQLVSESPTHPEFRRELARGHLNLGQIYNSRGQVENAEAAYVAAQRIYRQLAAEFPTRAEFREELASNQSSLAALLGNSGRLHQAMAAFNEAMALERQLVEDFPKVISYRVNLGGTCANLGRLLRKAGKPEESLNRYDLAIATLRLALDAEPRHTTARQFLFRSHWGRAEALDKIGKHAEAIQDWAETVQLSTKEDQQFFRAYLANSQVRAGQFARALPEIEALTKLKGWDEGEWYDFAVMYALVASIDPDQNSAHIGRAMELLQRAIAAGFKDVNRLKQDAGLDSLRDRPDFQKLLQELEEKYPLPT